MEPEQQNSPTASSEAEAARSRFLDSMGLGEAALRGLTPSQSSERSDGMVLSSQREELGAPPVAPTSPGARVVGVRIGSSLNEATAAADEAPPIQEGFEDGQESLPPESESFQTRDEAEIPSVASLEDDPVVDGQEVEEKQEQEQETLQLCCPKCSGELVIRREHVGIEGACVWCETKIVAAASGTDGEVRVFAVFQPDPAVNSGSTVVVESEESNPGTREQSVEEEWPTEEQAKPGSEPVAEQDLPEVLPEASAWSGGSIEMSAPESETVEERKTDFDEGLAEAFSPNANAEESFEVEGSEVLEKMTSAGFPTREAAAPEVSPSDMEELGMPLGFSDARDSNIGEVTSSPESSGVSHPFENALQPLPSGFGTEGAPAPQDGFGEFLQSNEKAAEVDAFGASLSEPESDLPAGVEDGITQAALWSGAVPLADAETNVPFEGGGPSPLPEADSHEDLEAGFEGDEVPQPLDSEEDPFAASAIFGGATPPPLNEIPEGFVSTRAEELEYSGDLPEPAPADSVKDSGFASGFAIPATSEQDSFSIDEPFTAEPASIPEMEAETSPNPPEPAPGAGWGQSLPIGVRELPAPEPAAEETNGASKASGEEALDSNGLFAPIEETEEPRSSVFGEPAPVPEVEESSVQVSESSDMEETMVQAIALPEAGATPTVTSQSLGGTARKHPRKGLVVFLVVLIGFTCGAALASFMLPVDEYVLKARAFMEEKFDPAAVQHSVVPTEVLTPDPEASTPES